MNNEIKENNETTIYDYKFVSIKDIKNQLQDKKIKEILDNLYRYKDEDNMKWQPEDILTIEDVWLLLDYITNLQEEKDKYKLRCYKAKKMIFDNYGVLDKYEIEMLEDILDGKSDE